MRRPRENIQCTESVTPPRSQRQSRRDYAVLAGIKRRPTSEIRQIRPRTPLPENFSPASIETAVKKLLKPAPFAVPDVPRFVRKQQRRRRPRDLDYTTKLPETGGSTDTEVVKEVADSQDSSAERPSTTEESKAVCEAVVSRGRKRELETVSDGKSARPVQRRPARNPALERDGQQKARKRLVRNGNPQRSSKRQKRNVVDDDLSRYDDTIAEIEEVEGRWSPTFVKYLEESRPYPKPDPDVYDWPKEWIPSPDTPLVPPETSAKEIDHPKIKPPGHVFDNTFYLQSPPKMRSEQESWKQNFDHNLEVEMARLKKIKVTERQLMMQAGRPRTKEERRAIKQQAVLIVDTEEYETKMKIYNQRRKENMEIMREVYRERHLGEPLVTDDIYEMAMDIKHKVFLKHMRNETPSYILVNDEKTDHGDVDADFTIPNVDTLSPESRKSANRILQETQEARERELGVVIHEAETRPLPGVNYIYDAYKRERKLQQEDVLANEHVSSSNMDDTSDTSSSQRMTMWYGHAEHRRLQMYKSRKYGDVMADNNKMADSRARDEERETQRECSSTIGYNQQSHTDGQEMGSFNDGYDHDDDDDYSDDDEGEDQRELEEKPSEPHMTLWYGHSQNNDDDEDTAVEMMQGRNNKRKHDDYSHDDDDSFNNVNICKRDEDDSLDSRGSKRKCDELELEECDDIVDDDKGNEEISRTVPFLFLTTEDMPLRVRTQTYKFRKATPPAVTHDTVTADDRHSCTLS